MSKLVPIAGNTYPVREQIKALGGQWDSRNKVWMVPEERAEAARVLAEPTEVWVCDECGAELYRPYCSGCRDKMMIRKVR